MIVRTITFAEKLAHTNPIFKDNRGVAFSQISTLQNKIVHV